MEKIYLDQKGYDQYLKYINNLRNKLKENSRLKSEAYTADTGNGWHDNFAFEESERQENVIINQINKMLENLENIILIDDIKKDNKVNINDVVELKFLLDDSLEVYKLTGNYITDNHSNHEEINLNSPVGKAIYHKNIGSIVEYVVSDNKYKLEIIKKIK